MVNMTVSVFSSLSRHSPVSLGKKRIPSRMAGAFPLSLSAYADNLVICPAFQPVFPPPPSTLVSQYYCSYSHSNMRQATNQKINTY